MTYQDLNLELLEHSGSDGERFKVRVFGSRSEEVAVPSDLRGRVARLERRELHDREMIELGKELGDLLLPPGARHILDVRLKKLRENQRLRIHLRFEGYSLADLPWEFAYLPDPDTSADQAGPEGFLALNRRISIVRHQVLAEPPLDIEVPDDKSQDRDKGNGEDEDEDKNVRMAILLSSPRGFELNLKEEVERINESLKTVSNIKAKPYWGGSVIDLKKIADEHSHVLHFAGHGEFAGDMGKAYGTVEGHGRLILTGKDNEPDPYTAQDIAGLLRGTDLRLVVLSACEGGHLDQTNAWTGIAPALIRAGIPAVVAMQYTIHNASAVAFSASFYQSLLNGEPIDAAVAKGRREIAYPSSEADRDTSGWSNRDWGVPVLYMRTEQAVLFPIKRRASASYLPNWILLLALLMMLGILYVQHVDSWLYQSWIRRIVEVLVALCGIWAFLFRPIQGLFQGIQEGAGKRIQAFLDRPAGTKYLLSALGLLVLIHVVTTSVYLSYSDPTEEGSFYRLQVLEGQDTLYQDLVVSRENPRAGRPSFFAGRKYEVRVTDPLIYRPLKRDLSVFWQTIEIPVPNAFVLKDQAALRLVPDISLRGVLPPPHVPEPARHFDLVLNREGKTATLNDVRYRTILIAADDAVLEHRLRLEPDVSVQDRMHRHLEKLQLPAGVDVAQWISLWGLDTTWTTDILQGNSELTIEILDAECGSPLVRKSHTLAQTSEGEIETLFLKVGNETDRR